MKAVALILRRVALGANAFAEIAIWRVSSPVPPSTPELLWRALTAKRRELLKVLCGAGPVSMWRFGEHVFGK